MYVLYSKAVVHLLTGHALHDRSDKIEDKDGYTRSRDKSSSLHTSHHKVSPGISSMVMEKCHGNISYRDSRWHHLSTRCLHGPRQWKNLPIYSRFHREKTTIRKKNSGCSSSVWCDVENVLKQTESSMRTYGSVFDDVNQKFLILGGWFKEDLKKTQQFNHNTSVRNHAEPRSST